MGLKFNIQKTKIMASWLIPSWQIEGKKWKQSQTLFSCTPISLRTVILKDAFSFNKKL